eukprot:3868979-Ditylum_brightwellii.AAC.1
MPTYNALSLQQAINAFQSMKCQHHSFNVFATKLGITWSELQQNGKSFTAAEIKNIFILGLGADFKQ